MVFVKLDGASNESETSESCSSVSEKKLPDNSEKEPSYGHYVASIKSNGRLIGPYDVRIMSDKYSFRMLHRALDLIPHHLHFPLRLQLTLISRLQLSLLGTQPQLILDTPFVLNLILPSQR